jgi:hypothetical protein
MDLKPLRLPFLFALLLALAPVPARAEEAPAEPAAVVVSDEVAAEALAVFEENFKAKGLKGDEKLVQQVFALRELGKVQHLTVVDRLAKETRNRAPDLRTEAVMQLGRQTALAGEAGRRVVVALKKHEDDEVFVMAALGSIRELGYLGAREELKALLKSKSYAIMQVAMETIGGLKDVRMIEDLWQLLKDFKIDKGASWDGVEVTYDTGTAGDHDQKMAEKIGKEKEAGNQGKKSAGRRMRDIGPVALKAMKDLTGEEFSGSIEAREWIDKNKDAIAEQQKALDEAQAAQ